MKVKITTGRNEWVIEHDDKEAIRNVVADGLNMYIRVEYIEYDYYSDAPVDGLLYVVGTDIRYEWTEELIYKTIQTNYGRICDRNLSIIKWSDKLFNLLAADYAVISKKGQKNNQEFGLILPPQFTRYKKSDDGTTKYTEKAEEIWIKEKDIKPFEESRYFKSFAWKFKQERTYTGLTQTEIAEIIKTSKRNIENWENGSSVPNTETQERVINQLREISGI